jgi:AbrB family looped-hinge helix DNA binding protein
MITSTISSKGQVTIPKRIREFLKVGTFDKIVFIPLEDGRVLITNKQNPAIALFGMLKHREPQKRISIEDMKTAVRTKRLSRGRK